MYFTLVQWYSSVLYSGTVISCTGYPWWPGMVDYCPELEETFLLDEESPGNEAAKYHVV